MTPRPVLITSNALRTTISLLLLTSLHASDSAEPPVDRIGPPRLYAPPIHRYQIGSPNLDSLAYYPIPQTPVTRETYMSWIENSGMLQYVNQPKRGLSGPTQLLPALAKFIQTSDPSWGKACITMLKDFHQALEREVAEKGWTEQFADPPAYLPLYRKHLIEGGLLEPDTAWFKDLWLYYCRNLHVWNSPDIEWRGPCHRAMPEALAKGLAAKWYPDIPEAPHWKHYASQVWDDFWRYKDLLQNDTGYFQDATRAYAFSSHELLDDDRYLAHPDMQPVWHRLMQEITPDGAIFPYGPNGGWNSTATLRIGVLERVATATSNGHYRFAAHKAMNYLLYQNQPTLSDGYLLERETAPYIVLDWLSANDTITPTPPPAGLTHSARHEVARFPHDDKSIVGRFLPNLDPTPGKAYLCCNQTFTGKIVPDKLVLRSGWNPGDLFALVELNPTSFPYNAGGIVGLTRWGSPFTQLVTSKGEIPENRMAITDLSGKASRRYIPDPDRISENWENGKMPSISTTLTTTKNSPSAAVARVEIQNPEGLPVHVTREFIFVHNQFLVSRELATFEEPFHASIAALWNTQNIGPQTGSHWANTFMTAPVASNGRVPMLTPPADLLVYFAPQPGWHMQVVDRTAEDPRTEVCPAQVRYVWTGTPKPGQTLHSTQLYYPHAASKARASSNMPGATAVYSGGQIAATAGASGISTLIDSPELTLIRAQFDPTTTHWILFNPAGSKLHHAPIQTDAHYAYLQSNDSGIQACFITDATSLIWNQQTIFSSPRPSDFER